MARDKRTIGSRPKDNRTIFLNALFNLSCRNIDEEDYSLGICANRRDSKNSVPQPAKLRRSPSFGHAEAPQKFPAIIEYLDARLRLGTSKIDIILVVESKSAELLAESRFLPEFWVAGSCSQDVTSALSFGVFGLFRPRCRLSTILHAVSVNTSVRHGKDVSLAVYSCFEAFGRLIALSATMVLRPPIEQDPILGVAQDATPMKIRHKIIALFIHHARGKGSNTTVRLKGAGNPLKIHGQAVVS